MTNQGSCDYIRHKRPVSKKSYAIQKSSTNARRYNLTLLGILKSIDHLERPAHEPMHPKIGLWCGWDSCLTTLLRAPHLTSRPMQSHDRWRSWFHRISPSCGSVASFHQWCMGLLPLPLTGIVSSMSLCGIRGLRSMQMRHAVQIILPNWPHLLMFSSPPLLSWPITPY